jgi:copper transporter 1
MGMTPMPSGGMMIAYLHFTGGDYLWLSLWAPSSRGEIAAACIGLFLMAILERLVAATRTMFDLHWHTRSLQMIPQDVNVN